jgi:hypothetical protein
MDGGRYETSIDLSLRLGVLLFGSVIGASLVQEGRDR